jgi:hypothetical protein
MTEWYSHFDARQLSSVMEAQQVITGAKKPDKTGEAGTVLPFPALENTRKRKGA